MVPFSQLPVVEKTPFLVHPKQIFGPSYIVRALHISVSQRESNPYFEFCLQLGNNTFKCLLCSNLKYMLFELVKNG